jgi:hypothetical protein
MLIALAGALRMLDTCEFGSSNALLKWQNCYYVPRFVVISRDLV